MEVKYDGFLAEKSQIPLERSVGALIAGHSTYRYGSSAQVTLFSILCPSPRERRPFK
jgi:hypothetical protein